MDLIKKIVSSGVNIVVMVLGIVTIFEVGYVVYVSCYSVTNQEERINNIYNNLWAQTGQTQDRLPLEIVQSDEINAYNDGHKIVVYTGLIGAVKSDDELALVLGHEIAHGNLYHLRMIQEWNVAQSTEEQEVLESNADKMGAVYMMKAGYNICIGRQFFKHLLDKNGDYLGANHPGYAYRYSELNINCE